MKKIIFFVVSGLLLANVSQAAGLVPDACAIGNARGCSLCELVQVVINASDILVGLTGAFALLMFVVGGIFMITAYGRAEWIEKGKKTVSAAIIGIGIVLLAWILVNFTIEALVGGNDGAFSKITGGRTWNQTGACAPQIELRD